MLVLVAGGAVAAPPPVEFRVAALVQAGPAAWPGIAADAPVRRGAPGKVLRLFLEPGPGMPSAAPAVRRALAAALTGCPDRTRVRPVLDAIGAWLEANVAPDPAPPGCGGTWRDAAAVLAARRGHAWERARVAVALARAAGIPARPTFNGVPLVAVHAAVEGGGAAWTTWDPFHPGAAARLLPAAWLPLRGGDVPPVTVAPPDAACGPIVVEVRRRPGRSDAERDVEAVRSTGRFPPAPPPPLDASATAWWEAWSIGGSVTGPGAWIATVALPYMRDLDYGTRAHAVWTADPARAPRVAGPLSETDPDAGGIVMTLRLSFPAAR